jgi:hypothetical protein
MARKKKTDDADGNGIAATEEAPRATLAEVPPSDLPKEARLEEAAPRPADVKGGGLPPMSWKYPAAAGVTVEVSLRPLAVTLQDGSMIEVYTVSIARASKDASGQWRAGGTFRIAELPVLVHALLRAHGYALDSREMNCPL